MSVATSLSKIVVILFVVGYKVLAERCQHVLESKKGSIRSPNYPENYPNNITCTWLIAVQDGYKISLKVASFNLEGPSPACVHDALVIHDGKNESANSGESPYCGRKMPSNFESSGNFLFFKFTTNLYGAFSGFMIEYRAEQNCNMSIYADNGTVSSPRYPAKYYSNADCHWTITTSEGTIILLNFKDFNLEGNQGGFNRCYDYVAFYDVIAAGDRKLAGPLCGTKAPSQLKTSSNQVRIHFFSDATVPDKGFLISFKAHVSRDFSTTAFPTKPATGPRRDGCKGSEYKCSNGNCLPNQLRCNQEIDCADQSDEIDCAGSCDIDNGGCEQKCNTHPMWKEFCSCETGYQLAEDKKTCQDVNECMNGNGGCGEICSNFVGGYKCECSSSGYQIGPDGKSCQDIDECLASPCEDTCENTVGSYQCKCREGFRPMVSGNCIDIDECAIGVPSCFDCVNTVGSYSCRCGEGFIPIRNASECEEIDECADGTHLCRHSCENTFGSYKCHCRQGYNQYDHQCVDINECRTFTSDCEQSCFNTAGSYFCGCRSGYELVNRTKCVDLNECKIRKSCQHGCEIVNSRLVCSCPEGYYLDANGKNCHKNMGKNGCGELQSFDAPLKSQFSEVARNTWPWEANLEFTFELSTFKLPLSGCIATIINSLYLLTTAHCLHFGKTVITASRLLVRFGAAGAGELIYKAERVLIHPDYYKEGMKIQADIGLIKLAKQIKPSYLLHPICINQNITSVMGDAGFLITRGRLDEMRFSPELREIKLTVQNSSSCSWLPSIHFDVSKMSCAGNFSQSNMSCLVDSGSPLMRREGNKWFLSGMLAYGAGFPNSKACSENYEKNAFYNLSYFYEWIDKNTSKNT